jgi:hypothetical protein
MFSLLITPEGSKAVTGPLPASKESMRAFVLLWRRVDPR